MIIYIVIYIEKSFSIVLEYIKCQNKLKSTRGSFTINICSESEKLHCMKFNFCILLLSKLMFTVRFALHGTFDTH